MTFENEMVVRRLIKIVLAICEKAKLGRNDLFKD